jgi:hypothetical protein
VKGKATDAQKEELDRRAGDLQKGVDKAKEATDVLKKCWRKAREAAKETLKNETNEIKSHVKALEQLIKNVQKNEQGGSWIDEYQSNRAHADWRLSCH